MSPITRVTFHFGSLENQRLALARVEDGISASDRIRAALQLWEQDREVRARINEIAGQLRASRLNRAAGSIDRAKVTVELGVVMHQLLTYARAIDGIPASERIRAALSLWEQDAELGARINEIAGHLRSGRAATKKATA